MFEGLLIMLTRDNKDTVSGLELHKVLLFSFAPWVFHARLRHSSAVPLGQSQADSGQEFVEGDVSLGGEVLGEHGGQHHQDAVRQDLRRTEGHGLLSLSEKRS